MKLLQQTQHTHSMMSTFISTLAARSNRLKKAHTVET